MRGQGPIAHDPDRPALPLGSGLVRLVGLGAALLLLPGASAMAYPFVDPSNQDQVPTGTELAVPDAESLQHQLQLTNGLAPPIGGGWTFVPRIDLQEMLTDNVMQQHSPRQWDAATFVSPGIGVAADLPRLKLTVDYAPTLAIYAHDGSLNALTQQLDGVGLLTMVPNLAYLDVRALSGVHSIYGGIGGLGTVGASATAANATAETIAALAGNSVGLNKSNEVQTNSFAISPYLLRQFGDYGTGKLGYSLDVTRSSLLTGFAASPLPVGGDSGQTLVTNEEIAHYATGDFLGRVQDIFDVDLQQSRSSTDASFVNGTSSVPGINDSTPATRTVITDQVNYAIDRAVTVFASGGHEDITYNGLIAPIDDLTWSLGTILTPNPDSQLTVSYGHLNGYNAFSANGHYALTSLTMLTVSYNSTLGTQLQNLQSQLDIATVNANGSLVNGQTGGQLFSNINALAVEEGVFRTDTLALGSQTTLDRDILSANLYMTKQTQVGGIGASSSTNDTVILQWTHELQPDLTLSGAIAYARQDQASNTVLNPGNSWSIAATMALQYQISNTLSASLRYAFFDRQSAVSSFSVYQNLLILGISKSF